MTTYVTNDFTIAMLERPKQFINLRFIPMNSGYIRDDLMDNPSDVVYAIGHKDTAILAAKSLEMDVDMYNRISIQFNPDEDVLYVFQYTESRLPEGVTESPEGAKLEWWIVQKP